MTAESEFKGSLFVNTLLVIGAFFIPFSSLRITPRFNISVGDFMLILAGGLIILYQFVIRRNLKFNFNNKYIFPWYLCGILILLGLMISDIISMKPKITDVIAQYLQYAFVYFFIVWIVSNLNYRIVSRMLIWIIIGYAVSAAISTVLYLWLFDTYMLLHNMGLFVLSVRLSPFMNPNTFSKNVALVIPILILLGKELGLKISMRVVIVVILTIASLLTASFGGLITMAITSLLAVLYSSLTTKRNRMKLTLLFIFLLLLLLSGGLDFILTNLLELPFMKTFSRRVLPVLMSKNFEAAGSYSHKTWLMSEGIRLISENPIIGVGTRQFVDKIPGDITMHNSYLLLWVEGGIISFIGFAALLIYIFFISLNSFLVLRDRLSISMNIVITGFAISSYTNNAVYDRSNLLIIILLFSLLASTIKRRRSIVR